MQEARRSAAEQHAERERTTCSHFNGTQNGKCKVGVPYEQFADAKGKLLGRLPCTEFPKGETPPDTCRLREYPTPEQVAVETIAFEKRMEDFSKAVKAAHEDAKKKGFGRGNGGRGSVVCPVCEKGTLHYSVAGVNGHLWSKCTTVGCMSWME